MITIEQSLCVGCGRCVEACPCGVFRPGEHGPEVGGEKRCIRCMHCAAACPRKAVRFEGMDEAALYPAPAEDAVLGLIQSRRSIRRYKGEAPDRAVLQKALDGAAWAPSAKNQRVCRWTVLYGREETDRAAETIFRWAEESRKAPVLAAMARSGKNLLTCGAPCVILCHAPGEAQAQLDAGIAMTTLELLLCRAGLGTCWGGFFTGAANASSATLAALGVPEGDEVCCALMVGYPDGEPYPNTACRPAADVRWRS